VSGWRRRTPEYINVRVSETLDICSYYEWNNWKYRHKWLTIGGEKGRYGVGVVHGGIPHAGACPAAGGAHGGSQYPWLEGGRGVLELCLDGRLEAVVAMSEAARLRETLPTTSRVLGPYENPVTWKFDSWMSKNLNSKLKKKESYTCGCQPPVLKEQNRSLYMCVQDVQITRITIIW
jgi:hypothetical protein